MKIAVILGSTRPGRLGEQVGQWVYEQAKGVEGLDAQVDLVDLADYDLDLLDDPVVPGAAKREYASEKTRRWGRTIDEYDGYVFVTPEYNHSVPAALKNAFDVLYPEWGHKSVGFVAYGYDGGTRAVEHWRTIVANAHMHAVRSQLSLSLIGDFEGESTFAPSERRATELRVLVKAVARLGAATAALRS